MCSTSASARNSDGEASAAGLLIALLAHARDRGVRDAFLEVRRTNRGAIGLYHEVGFECVGTRRGYYQAQDGREDALVYRLELGARSHKLKGTVTFTREAIAASTPVYLVKVTVPFNPFMLARPARCHDEFTERRNRPPTQLCDHFAPGRRQDHA
jgi:hypothetical protein